MLGKMFIHCVPRKTFGFLNPMPTFESHVFLLIWGSGKAPQECFFFFKRMSNQKFIMWQKRKRMPCLRQLNEINSPTSIMARWWSGLFRRWDSCCSTSQKPVIWSLRERTKKICSRQYDDGMLSLKAIFWKIGFPKPAISCIMKQSLIHQPVLATELNSKKLKRDRVVNTEEDADFNDLIGYPTNTIPKSCRGEWSHGRWMNSPSCHGHTKYQS